MLAGLAGPAGFSASGGTPPEARPDLPACAQKFGLLTADYWLTKDLERQIERGLSYGATRDLSLNKAGLKALQQRVQENENGLKDARKLYQTLFTNSSAEGLAQLAGLLERITTTSPRNTRAAEELLQQLGNELDPGTFRALPIKNSDLAPAWDRSVIGKNFRPKRILFGSIGRPGDNRTLPLDFDFGSGLYGAYVPMADPTNLTVSFTEATRSDPVHIWMQTHHSGHHYWAGVYNNQNTYVAPWFREQHKNDDDLWMKMADGKVLKSVSDWGQVNIWNPAVADYLQGYCEAQARAFKDDPSLVCYDYTAEPHPFASQPDGQLQYSGYNDSAIKAFREYLQKKFGTVAKLNLAWQTDHQSFAAIQPPPDKYLHPPARATGLSYEFERFRFDSHAALWKRAYDGYRKYDPTKPVVANAGMFMSGWPVEALDPWQLQKSGAADWADMHMNNFWPNLPEQIYLYSLCRLSGKTPVQFEYVWTFPRTGPFDDTSESDFAAVCQGSVWRNLAWGKKVLVFFDFYYDWPAYHNAFFDRDCGYSILRPSACVVPVTKRKALRFNDLLMETEVARPPIIILEPTASILNSPPLHPNKSFSYHSSVAGKEVHDLLFPKNYPFLYVPEQAVLDGYDLKQHQVIILPQAPYLPSRLTERLLTWIRQGGTLICLGPPGIWNPYGQQDMRILNAVFRHNQVVDDDPGKWKWNWTMTESDGKLVVQIKSPNGRLRAASAGYGKGRVLVSTGPFETNQLQQLFYKVLDHAIGPRPATCAKDSFELVLRETKQGRRYLFILNPHTRDVREDEITVAHKFNTCMDLGIGSGVPIPVSVAKTQTKFHLRLHPGEGTVISLR